MALSDQNGFSSTTASTLASTPITSEPKPAIASSLTRPPNFKNTNLTMSLIPPNQSPQIVATVLATPTIPPSILPRFSIACSTTIAAPPLQCLTKVVDTTTWPSWNTYCKHAEIKHAPPPSEAGLNAPELETLAARPGSLYTGVKAVFAAYPDPDGQPTMSDDEVTVLERFERDGRIGYRVAWKYCTLPWTVLHAERTQEFVESKLEDGSVVTEYRSWITFGGLFVPVLRMMHSQGVCDGFSRWMAGLKESVEGDVVVAGES